MFSKEKIKNWLVNKWYKFLYIKDGGLIKYKFLHKDNNPILLNYIELKAKDLADKEGVKIFNISFDEMNKNETVEKNKAVAKFIYIKGEEYLKNHNELLERCKKYDIKTEYTDIYPRIELSEKSDIFSFLHELGHYFIYKRKEIQTEFKADIYIEEFICNYLPPFFKWIFQIDINIRSKKNLNFTTKEHYTYYKDYKKWIKEHEIIKNESTM